MQNPKRRATILAGAFVTLLALASPALATGTGGNAGSIGQAEEPPAVIEIQQVVPQCIGGRQGNEPSITVNGQITQPFEIPETFRVAATVDVPGLGNKGVNVAVDFIPGSPAFSVFVTAPDRFAGAAATIGVLVFEDLNGNGAVEAGEARSAVATATTKFGDCNELKLTEFEHGCIGDVDVAAGVSGATRLAVSAAGRVVRPVPAPETFRLSPSLFPGTNAEPEEMPEGALLDQRAGFDPSTGAFTFVVVLDDQLLGRNMVFSLQAWDDVNRNGVIDDEEQGSLSNFLLRTFRFPPSCE